MVSKGGLVLEDSSCFPYIPGIRRWYTRFSSNLLANTMCRKMARSLENPALLPLLALELIQMLAKVMQAQIWAVKIPVLVYKAKTAQAGVTQTPRPHHLYQSVVKVTWQVWHHPQFLTEGNTDLTTSVFNIIHWDCWKKGSCSDCLKIGEVRPRRQELNAEVCYCTE